MYGCKILYLRAEDLQNDFTSSVLSHNSARVKLFWPLAPARVQLPRAKIFILFVLLPVLVGTKRSSTLHRRSSEIMLVVNLCQLELLGTVQTDINSEYRKQQ